MPSASILVVDPDAAARGLIAHELRELGHDVSESTDAGSALRAARKACPDLMVCDFTLPDLAGIDLLGDIRRSEELKRMRVLMTSAANGSDDIVTALESGADDYVGKPIVVPELVARVCACLRRPAMSASAERIRAGGVTIDTVGHRIMVDDTYVSLAPREYRLLLFLLKNQDRVFSRKQLLKHVWDRDASIGPRTVDVHVRRLRGALEPFGYDVYLQTVRGTGYRFSLDG
jgi:two-component system phosphate regulon response regulator PhoB